LEKLGLPQVHIYDSDKEQADRSAKPETVERAKQVNRRHNCVAFVTRKRQMENYLHPEVLGRLSKGKIHLVLNPDDLDFGPMEEFIYQGFVQPLRNESAGVKLCPTDYGGDVIRLSKRQTKTLISSFLMREMTVEEIDARGAYTEQGQQKNEIEDWFEAIGKHLLA
jgi:hypothetical protein